MHLILSKVTYSAFEVHILQPKSFALLHNTLAGELWEKYCTFSMHSTDRYGSVQLSFVVSTVYSST